MPSLKLFLYINKNVPTFSDHGSRLFNRSLYYTSSTARYLVPIGLYVGPYSINRLILLHTGIGFNFIHWLQMGFPLIIIKVD